MQHGEQLAPLVDRALERAGIVRQDLTAIGVGVGPGPFTGLRVGLVTARTLGFVLDLPVYGVCTLDVLAVEAVDTGTVGGDFVVATDARRREVYLASYDDEGNGWARAADLYERLGRLDDARDALRKGIEAANRFGHPGMMSELEAKLEELDSA